MRDFTFSLSIISLNNLEETISFGKELGASSKKGDIFCLVGDLGTGKTMLDVLYLYFMAIMYPRNTIKYYIWY